MEFVDIVSPVADILPKYLAITKNLITFPLTPLFLDARTSAQYIMPRKCEYLLQEAPFYSPSFSMIQIVGALIPSLQGGTG